LEREPFDVVLMDVQMPRMDGFEATRAIRAKERDTGKHMPIIALTAHAVKGDRERCLEEGVDAYVSKPIKADALYEEMERLAGGSRGKKVKVCVPSQTEDKRAADVFDLSEALDYLDGNMELFKEISDLFFDNLPDTMSEIKEAYVGGDFGAMERAAHRLKGSVSNLGAKRAFELARRIELMGREGVAEETDAALLDLQKECDHLKVAIQGVTG
jgi:response regulator RpfG family c-di-GMP phosphodiesterase